MFTGYNIILSDGDKTVDLTYKLNSSPVSQIWAKLMTKVSPNDIRPYSTPWRGIFKDLNQKIVELNEVIESLNQWLPEKIQGTWDDNDPNESLNRLHVHFADVENQEAYRDNVGQLPRYNDLIHEIQLLSWIKKTGKENMQLIICPENDSINYVDIPEESFKEFTHLFEFGDLVLHYCHVGKPPFSIFIDRDSDIPRDQIVPQTSIYAYHSLRFFDLNFDKKYFDDFYKDSKIDWPFELNDPRLAFGYIKMGKLESVDGKNLERNEIYSLVRNSNTIVDWKVF